MEAYISKIGLSNMCNVAHVKIAKSSNFLLKNNNNLFKNYTFSINAQVSIHTYYFKLFNMCKFTHDRKTQFIFSFSNKNKKL
jgi:hypothetical protein